MPTLSQWVECVCFVRVVVSWQLLTDRFNNPNGGGCDLSNYCGGSFNGVVDKLDYITSMVSKAWPWVCVCVCVCVVGCRRLPAAVPPFCCCPLRR